MEKAILGKYTICSNGKIYITEKKKYLKAITQGGRKLPYYNIKVDGDETYRLVSIARIFLEAFFPRVYSQVILKNSEKVKCDIDTYVRDILRSLTVTQGDKHWTYYELLSQEAKLKLDEENKASSDIDTTDNNEVIDEYASDTIDKYISNTVDEDIAEKMKKYLDNHIDNLVDMFSDITTSVNSIQSFLERRAAKEDVYRDLVKLRKNISGSGLFASNREENLRLIDSIISRLFQ